MRVFETFIFAAVVVLVLMVVFSAALYPVGMIGRSMYVSYVSNVQSDTSVAEYTLTDVSNWAVDGVAGTKSGSYGGALLLVLFMVTMGFGYVAARIKFARELQ